MNLQRLDMKLDFSSYGMLSCNPNSCRLICKCLISSISSPTPGHQQEPTDVVDADTKMTIIQAAVAKTNLVFVRSLARTMLGSEAARAER